MRILIDLLGAQTGSRFRGIGRYSLAFAQALARNRGEHEIVVLLSSLFPDTLEATRKRFEDQFGSQVAVAVWEGVSPCSFSSPRNDWRRHTSQILREAFVARHDPDVVILSSLFEGPNDDSIVTVGALGRLCTVPIFYDLIPLIYPEQYLSEDRSRMWYDQKLDYLKRADACFSISESSRREVIEHIGLDPDKVVNISAAVDPKFRVVELGDREKRSLLGRFGIRRPYLLYSGATDPRKNLRRLLEAFCAVPGPLRQAHQLVLAGGMPHDHRAALERQIRSMGFQDDEVVFTGHLVDDDLIALYNQCHLFVFPSLHEGFGLPALEAMSCGAPTIGSNMSSVPEVIGMERALFDPHSVDSITEAIVRVLNHEEFRRELAIDCLQRSKMFSWTAVAESAIKSLECLHTRSSTSPQKVPLCSMADLIVRIAEIDERTEDVDLLLTADALSRLEPRTGLRKLFIDISELHRQDLGTGIQRVVRSLVAHILTTPLRGYDVELVYAKGSEPYRSAGAERFDVSPMGGGREGEVVDPREGDLFLVLDFHDQLAVAQAARYSYMRSRGVRVVFVIYDLLPAVLSRYFVPEHQTNFEQWLRVATSQDACICISKSVAAELTAWIERNCAERLERIQISWFHLGSDLEGSRPSQGLPSGALQTVERLADRPTFLMVGTIEPRKGHRQVLAAFEELWRRGFKLNLVVVGRQGWMVDELVSTLRVHDRRDVNLFWLESISDEYLARIYATATCLIAASEGEGFGLPLVEAAQNGVPIIARDLPVFREVAGEHAYYFSGSERDDVARAVLEFLELYREGKHPKSAGMKRLTWKESAEQLLTVLGLIETVEKST